MKNIFLFIFLICSVILYSQISIQAKLINSESRKPIEFASILNLNNLEGTITDTLGFFNLNVDDLDQKLMIQSLGFKTDTFLVKDILKSKIISLEVNNFEISEIVIYPKSAFEIVRKAVSKIEENYKAETMAQNVFFREELFANNKLLSIKEANFNALSKFKNEENENLVSVNKARFYADLDTLKVFGKLASKQIAEMDTADIRKDAKQFFKMDFLLSDKVGDSKTSLLGEKSIKNYKYNYNGIVKKDEFIAYHITFDQIDNLKKSLYKGHFYIDTASLGFIEIQIYASPKGLEYQKYIPKAVKLVIKLFGFSFYIKGMSYHLHYTQKNEKWVLDKAKTRLSAIVSKKDYSFDGYVEALFQVNKFYPKESFYNKKSIYDKIDSDIKDFKNTYFWGDLYQRKYQIKE